MKKFIITFLVLLISLPVSAQLVEQAPTSVESKVNPFGAEAAPTPFSLLDFSRIKWSHSYSVTYFSGAAGSGTGGMLNSYMFYDISSKLSLSVNVGIAHNPGALWGDKRNNETDVFPGFRLDYHPSDSFQMSVAFQRYAGSYYYPYYNRRGLFSGW